MSIIYPDIDLTGIKGVMIDIDDTLYCYIDAHEIAIKECHRKLLNIYPDFEQFEEHYTSKRNETVDRLHPQGACRSRFFAFQAMFEECNIAESYVKAMEFEKIYWDTLINNIKIDSNALHFLKKCKKAEIKICAVSDMQANIQVRKLMKLGIVEYIDFLVTSEETGEEKPSKRMFSSALKKLSLSENEVIMVGDNKAKDIEGAEKSGIKSYLVRYV